MVGKGRWVREELLDAVEEWLLSDQEFAELAGKKFDQR